MCTQHIYEDKIKQEFRRNLIAIEKAIEEANFVLLKKYKSKIKKDVKHKTDNPDLRTTKSAR